MKTATKINYVLAITVLIIFTMLAYLNLKMIDNRMTDQKIKVTNERTN